MWTASRRLARTGPRGPCCWRRASGSKPLGRSSAGIDTHPALWAAHARSPRLGQGCGSAQALSLWQGRHADPLCAPTRRRDGKAAATLASRSRSLHVTRVSTRVRAANECERGLLPPSPRDLRRAADRARIVEGAGRKGDPLAAITGGAPPHQRRREGRTRRARTDAGRRRSARPMPTGWRRCCSRHIETFASLVIARKAYAPADLEALNLNLVGGDPVWGASCGLRPAFRRPPSLARRTMTRPSLASIRSAPRPIRAPGFGGGSGFLFASALK